MIYSVFLAFDEGVSSIPKWSLGSARKILMVSRSKTACQEVLRRWLLSRKCARPNITSTTALEVPPFPGECIYHTTKAAQEAFTNSLRAELAGTNIQVIAVRPGVVATNFHEQRVGYDKDEYDGFMSGFEPLRAEDVARQVVWAVVGAGRERVCVRAVDVVPTAQRLLCRIDREWNERNGKEEEVMREKKG